MKPPILITGCARSGTSMTAGIINMCGAFGGKMSGPTKNNKRGMFENEKIRNKIVKPYLADLGVDPMGQHPLPDIHRLHPSAAMQRDVEGIIKSEGYEEGPWFYKGAKMCLFWPLWNVHFPTAKWIIVRRADEDIVFSCMRTVFMRAFQSEEGWQDWVDEHKDRFVEMFEAGMNIREVWPSKFVNGDFTEIHEVVVRFLGLEWNKKAVMDFIEPALWSTKNG